MLPGCGLVALVCAIGLTVLLAWIFGMPSGYDSGYHPFRSRAAAVRFQKAYDELATGWPVPVEDVILRSRFGETHVRISGPGDAPPLVLLHGVGGNALQWSGSVSVLSEAYRLYVPDIITENGTSVYRMKFDHADDYVAWLDDTLDQLGLTGSVNMAGMSYGGWITARYALARSDRVSRIVLVAPAGTVAHLSMEWVKRALKCVWPNPDYTHAFMQWLCADTWESGPAGQRIVTEWADFSYLCVRSFKVKQTVNPDVLTDREWQSLKMPVLVMVGENERIYDAGKAVARVAGVAPDVHIVMIPGAGHDLLLVKPEVAHRILLEFLGGNDDVQQIDPEE